MRLHLVNKCCIDDWDYKPPWHNHSTRCTRTRMLATSLSASKLPHTLSLVVAKASIEVEPSIAQCFHKLRVLHRPKASCWSLHSSGMHDSETRWVADGTHRQAWARLCVASSIWWVVCGIWQWLAVWWNGGARRQRAHHQHAAAPLLALQKDVVRNSGSGSRSIGRGGEDMILPSSEYPCNRRRSAWDQKLATIVCVTRCIMRWDDMMKCDASWDTRWEYSLSTLVPPEYILPCHGPSPSPMHLRILPSPSPSSSSRHLRTPAVAQYSAKLGGGGVRETGIFRPQWAAEIITLVDTIVWTLSLLHPPRRDLTMPHSHVVDNSSLRFLRKGG